MKKRIIMMLFLIVLIFATFTGCKKKHNGGDDDGSHITPPVVDVYNLSLKQSSITLKVSEVANYNFKSLFTLKLNNQEITIDDKYITSNVKPVVGEYNYTVSVDNQTKTLKVNVIADPVTTVITVKALKESLTLKDTSVATYNFKSLFEIKVNDEIIEVKDEYLNLLPTDFTIGSNQLTCTYEGKSATVNVTIEETIYEITLSVTEITINLSLAKTYDYKALFTFKIDGEILPITDEMIENNVKEEVGSYTYIVSIKNIRKVLTVNITNDHAIEIDKAYEEVTIPLDEIETYDYTSLFALYVDGKAIEVKKTMLDLTSLTNAIVDQKYEISLTYQIESTIKTAKITINVAKANEIVINAKNIVIYPNSERIDLTTLFTITKGDLAIEVTNEMISGSIDYENAGINEITINYQNITKVATVEVRKGVIIETPHGEKITIVKGTNQANYNFTNDFKVIINGIYFNNISESYLVENNARFDEVGEYTVTLKIPYNDKKLGLSGVVDFVYVEKTITYQVVENQYEITLNEEVVTLPMETTEFDVFKNLNVKINNRNQTLTQTKEDVDIITCYVRLISEPINFNYIGMQEVAIEVYVNGVNSDPVVVRYQVMMDSAVEIITQDIIAFTGDTIFARDLFTITNGQDEIEVTNDMITGKIDTFKAGVYFVTIDYMGIQATSRVVVYDQAIKGVYHTDFTTIPIKEDDDDDEYGEGYYDQEYYSILADPIATSAVSPYLDLIINNKGEISFNGKAVNIIKGIDEHTILINYYSYQYLMHIENGIITLDPNNDLKLSFNDYKRPLVYFSEDLWTIDSKVVINSSANYVLENNIISYSFDIFNLTSKVDNRKFCFALKTDLVEKTSADTIYVVTFGEAMFDENFQMETGISSSLSFDGEVYQFTMTENQVGKINLPTSDGKQYTNMIFKGMIDGINAEIHFDQYQSLTLYLDTKKSFTVSYADIEGMKNGGFDYDNDIVFVYQCNNDGVFSYKFILDLGNKTFEVVAKDKYFGEYVYENKMIFIDGYGMGLINFDTKSYYTTQFTYNVVDNFMTINYLNTRPTFNYGTSGKLYVEPILNILTVKDLHDPTLKEAKFENQFITDGAIVRIKSLKIGKNSDTIAKNEFYNNIEIITKDGVMSNDEKKNCITTNTIRFGTPGFYQFAITINVAGEDVVSYYAIQVISPLYEDSPLVGTYGAGVIFKTNSLSIDKYGQIILDNGNVRYEGMIKINDDMSFIANLMNVNGETITLTGQTVANGIILVKASGAVNYSDYYLNNGTSYVSGTKGIVLRALVVGNNVTFIYATSETIIGEVVTVTSLNGINPTNVGAILEIGTTNKKYVKISSWNDAQNGLIVADEYRGTYTNDENEQIELDGFGNIKIANQNGTYILNNNVITVTISSNTMVYRLNNQDYTYEEIPLALDNSLVNGKTFTAEYTFFCGSYPYTANTTFIFGDNGVVTIKSVSPSHDEGEDACMDDLYNPTFASKTGLAGTYLVKGNQLTITIKGVTFVFVIDNVLFPNTITLISTTLDSSEHGYFGVNTKFNAN